VGFTESDPPNFGGSFYSRTKGLVEEMLGEYDNLLQLRLRMPISSDLANGRNFVKKIVNYAKVVDIPNSMTVLDELLPISIEMARRGLKGIFNFTNPGVVSHNEVLAMYRDAVDPEYTWNNFSEEEQAKARSLLCCASASLTSLFSSDPGGAPVEQRAGHDEAAGALPGDAGHQDVAAHARIRGCQAQRCEAGRR
jgi:hypothetical protein